MNGLDLGDVVGLEEWREESFGLMVSLCHSIW